MTLDKPNLREMLDQFSLALISGHPDDLLFLGDLLEKIEQIQIVQAPAGNDGIGRVVMSLKATLESVTLDQVPNKDTAMELVGRGVALLRDMDGADITDVTLRNRAEELLNHLKNRVNVDLTESVKPGRADISIGSVMPAGSADPSMDTRGDFAQGTDLFFNFFTESMEHIENIKIHLITLEQNPDDRDAVDAIYHLFHTIKGVSGFLGLRQIHRLAHQVENILDAARNERISVSAALIDVVLDTVDIMKQMIADQRALNERGSGR